MDDFELEIKRDFLQEAKDLLENTEQSFLELENDSSNLTLIDTIFRFAHNLKGTSRAVGFGQIAELTHVAESLLLEIKQGKLAVSDSVVSSLLAFNDKVKEMIEGLNENIEAQFEFKDLIVQLENVSKGNVAVVASEPKVVEHSEAHNNVVNLQEENHEETNAEEGGAEEHVAEVVPLSQDKKTVKKEVKKEPRKEDETIRVSLTRLERLNDMAGELVILQSLVEASLIKSGDTKIARSLGKLCTNIQDMSMSLRMVPVGPTFQKLNRIVRDTSKLLGKKVELKLIGEDTEIDKTVIENLADPLVHIIRNAIDHGVESPDDRLLASKEDVGVVEVMAFHEGNNLVIQITDDGKGIDGERLIEKAKAKGIIPKDAKLTTQQGIELIFHPGFSTKDQVSEVSGRGVGMDVVKTNIENLGGEVKVRSLVGKGSCFRLILPLTLAIIEGILVKSGGQTFVVPKSQIQEVIRLDGNNISAHSGRNPYYTLRGVVVPLFFLEHDLGSVQKVKSDIALIVRQGEVSFAVAISDILRQQQVVVKPVPKEVDGKHGIMGTTILGNGKPALIIDVIDIYKKRIRSEKMENAIAS